MSTLDCAGNSNCEIPTHLWNIAKNNPATYKHTYSDYMQELNKIYEENLEKEAYYIAEKDGFKNSPQYYWQKAISYKKLINHHK